MVVGVTQLHKVFPADQPSKFKNHECAFPLQHLIIILSLFLVAGQLSSSIFSVMHSLII